MYTTNFKFITDFASDDAWLGVTAYGLVWNLHDIGGFVGFQYNLAGAEPYIRLSWEIPERVQQFRDSGEYTVPNYPCDHFSILFINVERLEVFPRDPEVPFVAGEDECLDMIGFLETGEDMARYALARATPHFIPENESAPYDVAFRFRGGQVIRIGAEQAEFVCG